MGLLGQHGQPAQRIVIKVDPERAQRPGLRGGQLGFGVDSVVAAASRDCVTFRIGHARIYEAADIVIA